METRTALQKMWQQNPSGQFRGTEIPQNMQKMTLEENHLLIAHWDVFPDQLMLLLAIKKDDF